MRRGKVKRQLYLRPVGTLVVRERMGKALQCRVAAHCQWVGAPDPPGRQSCSQSTLKSVCTQKFTTEYLLQAQYVYPETLYSGDDDLACTKPLIPSWAPLIPATRWSWKGGSFDYVLE